MEPGGEAVSGHLRRSREWIHDLEAENARLRAALGELLAAGQFCIDTDDDVTAMLRFGRATDAAHAIAVEARTTDGATCNGSNPIPKDGSPSLAPEVK